MRRQEEPLLVLTMGCPAGVGPDVILAGARDLVRLPARILVLGDARVLRERARILGLSPPLSLVKTPEEARAGRLNLLSLSELSVQPGKPTLEGFQAMVRYIREGVRLCLSGQAAALVTGPISKEGLAAAGEPYPGHTEMLAALTGAREVAMAFWGERLRVVLVTTHLALKEALKRLSPEAILRAARLAHRFLQEDLGIKRPRLALSALNPHAGEGGLFGDEEARILAPAVEAARREGLPLEGPFPADSLFFRAASGEFDLVVALYHDQGLIPFKLLHFRDGVNVTLGLPIVRTSVDHGTAYEIAGTGRADPASLIAAVALALRVATHRLCRPQVPPDPDSPYRLKA
ncbi:4-hydroxythreonine-4-phosphate dehydrogenase PdxA [Thermosulfurimonas marina]|uniref:4-hydroxythreonine-4-phosphate dehydrogenase n=1 Tax=Thermosulfurimonas marina TaxID=2047767 RepID=A0A6H1WRZ3_9BACT|nr:4-hydroxythreonine-4-phosphate dehydrogenase PdxA [Thermosulfurimonas marina]QJA05924.1 4-hydroxythreonine-4-phosphate dehydrogenase PdxA [Thermosulfurimonas marina]